MRVRFTSPARIHLGRGKWETMFDAGREVDLPEDQAFRWLRRGVAERIDGKKAARRRIAKAKPAEATEEKPENTEETAPSAAPEVENRTFGRHTLG